jgi:hypothetical protein
MRPERRFKPGMDGGLRAAVLVSPPHHLRTAEFLSKRWGPPQLSRALIDFESRSITKDGTLFRSAETAVAELRSKIDVVEKAVQKRLRYEEA